MGAILKLISKGEDGEWRGGGTSIAIRTGEQKRRTEDSEKANRNAGKVEGRKKSATSTMTERTLNSNPKPSKAERRGRQRTEKRGGGFGNRNVHKPPRHLASSWHRIFGIREWELKGKGESGNNGIFQRDGKKAAATAGWRKGGMSKHETRESGYGIGLRAFVWRRCSSWDEEFRAIMATRKRPECVSKG